MYEAHSIGANVENASYGHNFHFELIFRWHHLCGEDSSREGSGIIPQDFEAKGRD